MYILDVAHGLMLSLVIEKNYSAFSLFIDDSLVALACKILISVFAILEQMIYEHHIII